MIDITKPIEETRVYLNSDMEPITDYVNAKYVRVTTYDENGDVKHERLFSAKQMAKEEFKEQEHPRDEDGKFTDKDGGGTGKKEYIKAEDLPKDSDYIKDSEKHSFMEDGKEYEFAIGRSGGSIPKNNEYRFNREYRVYDGDDEYRERRSYDDNGKLAMVETIDPRSGVVISAKEPDLTGRMFEMRYNDEDHAKYIRDNFISYEDREKWDKLQKKKESIKNVKDINFYTKDIEDELYVLRNEFSSLANQYKKEFITEDEYNKQLKVLEKKELSLHDKKRDIVFGEKYDDISPLDDYNWSVIKEKRKNGRELLPYEKQTIEKVERIHSKLKDDVKDGNVKMVGGKSITPEMAIAYHNSKVDNNIRSLRLEKMYKQQEILENEANLIMERYDDDSLEIASNRLKLKYDDLGKKYDEKISELADASIRLKKSGINDANVTNNEELKSINEELKKINDKLKNVPERVKKIMDTQKKYKAALDNVYSEHGWYQLKRNYEEIKKRVGAEVLTPLTAKRQHIFSFDDGNKKISEETITTLYDLMKQTSSKNTWVKNYKSSFEKNKMNFDLIAGKGELFSVGEKKDFRTGAHWVSATSSIQFYEANKDNVKYHYHHEMAHSQWDALQDAFDDDRQSRKEAAFNEFKSKITSIDLEFSKKIFGDYFSSYLEGWQRGNKTGKVMNVHTEAFSALTDLRHNKHGGHRGYELFKERYPKLATLYETLKGESGVVYEMLRSTEAENNKDKDVYSEEMFYLDSRYNFVDKEDAVLIYRNGYNKKGKLVARKTFVEDI